MIRTEMPTPTATLIGAVERALADNDGDALEAAWFSLYALDPAQAVHVANIMRPLSEGYRNRYTFDTSAVSA